MISASKRDYRGRVTLGCRLPLVRIKSFLFFFYNCESEKDQ